MSTTCTHPDADAAMHPGCPGCLAVLTSQLEAVEHRTQSLLSTTGGRNLDETTEQLATSMRELARSYSEGVYRVTTGPGVNAARSAFARHAQAMDREGDEGPSASRPGRWSFGWSCRRCHARTGIEVPILEIALDADPGRLVASVAHDLERKLASACECILGELLPARDLTPDERAAHDEPPRPGVWVGDAGADGRPLNQHRTDILIRSRLAASGDPEVQRMIGPLVAVQLPLLEPHFGALQSQIPDRSPFRVRAIPATRQRGGIDSDPMVRVLAFRAWGDRDRRWFERDPRSRGARAARGELEPR